MASIIDCGDIIVRGRTYVRDDETGRFVATVNTGAAKGVKELARTLARLARTNITSMMRKRTGELAGSVQIFDTNAQRAEVDVTSGHAAPLEEGSVPHWIPNAFGRGIRVWWYGKAGRGGPPGFGFMRKAEDAVNAMSDSIMRKHLP